MSKKELTDRAEKCKQAQLCFISLEPLEDDYVMQHHSEVGQIVPVNKKYIKG